MAKHLPSSALTALERLVSCRGPAVLEPSPYERSATLLPTLISLLTFDGDDATRSSVLRVIGLLGALEPLQYRAAIAKAEATASARSEPTGGSSSARADDGSSHLLLTQADLMVQAASQVAGSGGGAGAAGGGAGGEATVRGAAPPRQWGDDLSPSSPQYLPTIALRELMAILHDASLSAYHHRLIAAIVYIFTALGDTCAPLLPRVMPTLLTILLAGDTSIRGADGAGNSGTAGGPAGVVPVAIGVSSLSRPATTQVFNHLMQQLPVLVSAMHAHLPPWVPQLVELVRMHWHGPLLLQVITLLEQLTLLLRQELTPYTAELIPLLAAVVDSDSTAQVRAQLSSRSLLPKPHFENRRFSPSHPSARAFPRRSRRP